MPFHFGDLPVESPVGAQKVVEGPGQAAVHHPEHGGGVAHHFFRGRAAEHLHLGHRHRAGGKQVQVADNDAPLAAPDRAGPARQGRADVAQPVHQLAVGQAEGQQGGPGGGGGETGGSRPQQPLRGLLPHGRHEGAQRGPQQEQRCGGAVGGVASVLHLELASEAKGGAGQLGIGGLAGPKGLTEGHHVRGTGLSGGFGGEPVRAAAGVLPPQGKGKAQSGHRREGQKARPPLQPGGGEPVGQGKDPGEHEDALRPGTEGEKLLCPGGNDLITQQPRQEQQAGQHPAAQLKRRNARFCQISSQSVPGQNGQFQRAQDSENGRQRGEFHPNALTLQPL